MKFLLAKVGNVALVGYLSGIVVLQTICYYNVSKMKKKPISNFELDLSQFH